MASVFKGQSAGKSERVSPLRFCTDAIAVGNACRALNVATGFPAPVVADAARQLRLLTSVFSAAAVPSFRSAGRHLALAEVAAMDAVEGRARFARPQQARFGK